MPGALLFRLYSTTAHTYTDLECSIGGALYVKTDLISAKCIAFPLVPASIHRRRISIYIRDYKLTRPEVSAHHSGLHRHKVIHKITWRGWRRARQPCSSPQRCALLPSWCWPWRSRFRAPLTLAASFPTLGGTVVRLEHRGNALVRPLIASAYQILGLWITKTWRWCLRRTASCCPSYRARNTKCGCARGGDAPASTSDKGQHSAAYIRALPEDLYAQESVPSELYLMCIACMLFGAVLMLLMSVVVRLPPVPVNK